MKRKGLIALVLVMVCMVGIVWAAERYFPGKPHTGDLGLAGRPWQNLWTDYVYVYGGTAYYGKITATPTGNRTWTVPDISGTVAMNNCTKAITVGSADSTIIPTADTYCAYVQVYGATNVALTTDVYVTTPIPGMTYTIQNQSGKVLRFRVVGGASTQSIANGKHALYITNSADVLEAYEQS